MDRYVVIGNPVSHSLSPKIHALFAAQLGEALQYSTLEAPLDDFSGCVQRFFAAGGRGANVTLPFKEQAFALARDASARARLAGAANFLVARDGAIACDNTDGAGLVADLRDHLGIRLDGARILLLGAGGAARGVVAPLLEQGPAALVVANRTVQRAAALAQRFASMGPVAASGLDDIPHERFDVIVNATSTSTRGERLDLAPSAWHGVAWAYDMAYGAAADPFLAAAREHGCRTSDGLGMLVEQAAESYLLWRGRRPLTAPVLAALRPR